MNLLDRLLPEPNFVEREPQKITQDLLDQYQTLTGKTLYPAQVERILIDIIAYRENLLREAIQDAAKLNLVRYSRAPILDFLGENIGVTRIPAIPARTTLTLTFESALSNSLVIPKGTIAKSAQLEFATIADVTVAAGSQTIQIDADCTQAGEIGNGILPGQINQLANALSDGIRVASLANTLSSGGAASEDDEHFRQRIVLAPEQFSNAGSMGAYRFHALSAHPDIIDVAVVSPSPGIVTLYPLVTNGLPTQPVIDAVKRACNADTVRPLTDQVLVAPPQQINFQIIATLTCYKNADAGVAKAQAEQAVQSYCGELRGRLGHDIVRTQIINALYGYGVYSIELTEPAYDQVLEIYQWPNNTAITIQIATNAVDG